MKITEHFTLKEVIYSNTALANGVDNTLPTKLYAPITYVAQSILEPVRTHYGAFSPTSWYRCPELNKLVGGSVNSQHMDGEAVDIKITGVPTKELADWIAENLTYDQLILENYVEGQIYSGRVHCSYKFKDNRMEYKNMWIDN